MSEKIDETERLETTRAEVRRFLKERAARHKDPIKKRKADLRRIAKRSRAERDKQNLIESAFTKVLDENQKKIVVELKDAADLRRDAIENIDFEDSECLAYFEAANADYESAIIKAIRADLVNHPLVRARISVQRNFGERALLRRYSKRRGLEKGVRQPMKKLDAWTIFQASHPAAKGKKPRAIRRKLVKAELSPKPAEWLGLKPEELKTYRFHLGEMSRQGFHKLLKRLQIIDADD